MAAKEEAVEEFAEEELEVAAILCGLKKALRARERRWRRRMQRLQVQPAAPEIPSWGRRRPRSMPEEKQPASPAPAPAPAPVEKRDGAASPNTPLAYPESGGDDAPAEEEEVAKKPASLHDDQWMQEQHGVVASLSQENAHLVKQIEEYRARLQSSRSTNESLKHLHKVKREREQQLEQEEQEQQAQKMPPAAAAVALGFGLGLDLNEPARSPEEEEHARAQQAQMAAAAAAAEWYRHVQMRAAMQKAAVSAGARRRRLEIMRAKGVCPTVSSKARRVG
ncbi:hypothetical protein HU200_046701 [Digitaria exilis]|uniref:Uncharacterized protein n=1 Tax=Digitaria exilis TaxID=1010633 RepID=A0A835AYR9_9POAL|nr:hypothetical protein HU200_046701 [Digitaria exilis]